jgi:hypothetical protein
MKAAFVGQLFERAKCFVDRNALALRRLEDQAYRSDGRKPKPTRMLGARQRRPLEAASLSA